MNATRVAALILACCCACSTPVHAQTPPAPAPAPAPASAPAAAPIPPPPTEPSEVAVYLKNGQRVVGLLIDANRESIALKVAGIPARLPMSEVERYDILPPVMQRYKELRDSIGDDADQIVQLAQWLQARERYPLALTEVQRALLLDPDHGPAQRLKAVLEGQILLRSKAPEADRPREAAPPEGPEPENAIPQRPRPGDFPLLSVPQIALMKVYELDLTERPRLSIPRDAVLRMLEAHAGHPLVPVTREGRDSVLRRTPVEVLDLMFRLQAREFYPQVHVIDQPKSLRLFRENIQRTWLMSCATNACHGGLEAGRLILHNRNPNSEPSVYTNFLILERFVTSTGQPLINWDNPERSPLLHLALPREDSVFPHPVAPMGAAGYDGWKPEFRSTEDRPFVKSVEWLRAMYRPRPDYLITYNPLRPLSPPAQPAPAGLQTPDPAAPVPR